MTSFLQETDEETSATDVAVVGMACRFPGAANTAEFWSLLSEGREASSTLTDDVLRSSGVPDALIRDPAYVKTGMFLKDMEQFDPSFFGFSPLDGRIMDPQHRQFLECTWEALEDAGYDPSRYAGSIGIFAGSGQGTYLHQNLLSNPQLVADVGFFLLRHTGNDKDFLATRASYCFDLKGPSINVQTACSTSLVAIHSAIQSLLGGECDMALAGGVTIELPHRQGYLFKEGEILSPDGHCRPFDASGGGTVFGSGAGLVVLKRLDDALAEGDNIRAIIKASAVNNDGAGKVSYLAPSVDGQAAAIREALSVACVSPESVTFIEAHGTGTSLGDPIEVAALNQVYGSASLPKRHCAIGSVKSNIGHLDTAAGIASLIKVVLSLQARQIPGTLHFTRPNSAIDFSATPFYVNATLQPWDSAYPRRAGVSSLGVGGTNAHLVLQEAPQRAQRRSESRPRLLLLSARTGTSLSVARMRLSMHLRGAGRHDDLADIAHTLIEGRRHFRHRSICVAADHESAAALLDGSDGVPMGALEAPEHEREVAFMFAGGGTQYPSMGLGLYQLEAVYRETVDDCLRLVSEHLDFDLRALLFPSAREEREAADQLQRPSRALPALFITQYAQARLWQSWGVVPAAMIGHSMGENTAACLAGVFSLKDALGLVALRGRLFETLPAGGMLSISLSPDDLTPLLRDGLSIAARNAGALTVVSGPLPALLELERELLQREVTTQRIRINVAAHSSMLDPILESFGRFLRTMTLRAPTVPFLSNLTGDWITPQQAMDSEYWVQHLRQTVDFNAGVAKLLESDRYALLEAGPGRTLTSLAGANDSKRTGQTIVTSMRNADDPSPDAQHMLVALGRLWQGKARIDWPSFDRGEERRRVPLPTYAFDHSRCWIDPGVRENHSNARPPLKDWFLVPVWVPVPLEADAQSEGTACLIGSREDVALLRRALDSRFTCLVEVNVSDRYEQQSARDFRIGGSELDYQRLLEALSASGHSRIHLYLATSMTSSEDEAAGTRFQLGHLLSLGKALAVGSGDIASLLIVSRGAARTPGDALLPNTGAACLSGAMGPMSSELQLPVSMVDLPLEVGERELRLLKAEQVGDQCVFLAYRNGQRLKLQYQRISYPEPQGLRLRKHGVYLITGGLGGLGMSLARHLCSKQPIKLALLSRRALPSPGAEAFYVAGSPSMATLLDNLEQLKRSGSEIAVLQADVADRAALSQAIAFVERDWGRINGVFHAAGVLADAPIPLQTPLSVEAVLASKVDGAINLDGILGSRELDFLMLYSSTSAFAGVPGQAVYGAANAFMDGLAQSRAAAGKPFLAINWGPWKDVGMTAALGTAPGQPRAEIPDGARFNVTGNRYRRIVDGSDWIVADHRTKRGITLLPGTGFLELACQAGAAVLPGSEPVGIRDLQLLSPLLLSSGERRVVSVVFEPDGTFVICSSSDPEAADKEEWISEHARGRAFRLARDRCSIDILERERRCAVIRRPPNNRIAHAQMEFGARWQCVESIAYGTEEAVVRLRLRPEFRADLNQHPLHPALLDMATGAAAELIADSASSVHLLVPRAYGGVTWHAPLTEDLVSHVRCSAASTEDAPMFDIVIADPSGAALLEIEGFTLLRLGSDVLDKAGSIGKARREAAGVEALLSAAITPQEGMQAMEHLIGSSGLAQVVVSPLPPEPLLFRRHATATAAAERPATMDSMEREGIGAEYRAPSTEDEKVLSLLWQEALGVREVGVDDNFFELGGHSMLMIQLVARARKQAKMNLPLSQLYTSPTIAGWIRLAAESGPAPVVSRPGLQRVSREAYRRAEALPQDPQS